MDQAEHTLAAECFGYGRWDAPYWFIGPEQGQAAWENSELNARFEAFRKLNTEGLCDCLSFHAEIQETRWHRDTPPAALQPTWKFLILLLKEFLNQPTDKTSRRTYQRDHWGRSEGDTCVIELSGLPATSFKVARNRELFRQRRLQFIHEKMAACRPTFVAIYGKSQLMHWKSFWEGNTVPVHTSGNISTLPFTTVAFAPQPTAPGSGNQYWIDLGRILRRECNRM